MENTKKYPHFNDDYEREFAAGMQDELMREVKAMEKDDIWLHDVTTKDLVLAELPEAIDTARQAEVIDEYDLDPEIVIETSQRDATNLMVHRCFNGERISTYCIRDTARNSLYNAAKLDGSALGRMSPEKLAQTLNNGLEIAKGKSLVLIREGKASAFHSDSAGGYCIMPISQLLQETYAGVSAKFGKMEFIKGHHEHRYTSATWKLPEKKEELVRAYREGIQDVLGNAAKSQHPIDFTPGVRFYASDTASSAARLIPIFFGDDGREIVLVEGIHVKHERKTNSKNPEGTELYKKELDTLYALFENAIVKARELAKIKIEHPLNAIVSLSKDVCKIGKKWGSLAYEEAEAMFCGPVTAHDIYLVMSGIVSQAQIMGAPASKINFLSEAVAKIPTVKEKDWAEHDVAGVVAWKD